jgi:hypothetical protein
LNLFHEIKSALIRNVLQAEIFGVTRSLRHYNNFHQQQSHKIEKFENLLTLPETISSSIFGSAPIHQTRNSCIAPQSSESAQLRRLEKGEGPAATLPHVRRTYYQSVANKEHCTVKMPISTSALGSLFSTM